MGDPLTALEHGLTRLLERIGSEHPRYTEALTLQSRLLENISAARTYGDTETRRAERAQIVDALNQLALKAVGVSFNEISGVDGEGASPRPRSRSVQADSRSGGVYFEGEGPVHIQGDVVGGDQTKTSHETHFHGPVTDPLHTRSEDMHIGSMAVGADASLETPLVAQKEGINE